MQIFSSWRESPKVPDGWEPRDPPGAGTRVPIKNAGLLRTLLEVTLAFTMALVTLTPAMRAGDGPSTRPVRLPGRVHVFEDFETDIERRWWHRGVAEMTDLPPATGALPNTRAWRSAESSDFDD